MAATVLSQRRTQKPSGALPAFRSLGSPGPDGTEAANVTPGRPEAPTAAAPRQGPAVHLELSDLSASGGFVDLPTKLSGQAARETNPFLPSHPQLPPPSPLWGSCQVSPGVAPEAGTLKEPAPGPEGRGDRAPGSRASLPQPLDPGPLLRGCERAHTLCTWTSRQTWEAWTGRRARRPGSEGTGGQGKNDKTHRAPAAAAQLRVTSPSPLHRSSLLTQQGRT